MTIIVLIFIVITIMTVCVFVFITTIFITATVAIRTSLHAMMFSTKESDQDCSLRMLVRQTSQKSRVQIAGTPILRIHAMVARCRWAEGDHGGRY